MAGFAAGITASPDHPGAVPLDGLAIRHHKSGAAVLSAEVPSGGHLLHQSMATCVFNDLHTAAATRGIGLGRVEVRADGGFDASLTRSTGVTVDVDLEGDSPVAELEALVREVVENAVILRIVRASAPVTLASVTVRTRRRAHRRPGQA